MMVKCATVVFGAIGRPKIRQGIKSANDADSVFLFAFSSSFLFHNMQNNIMLMLELFYRADHTSEFGITSSSMIKNWVLVENPSM